jgi:cysteine synthase
MKIDNILGAVNGTPHVRINRLYDDRAEVWMKLERDNPGGSIKDRIAWSMIEDAERKGILEPDSVIVEPTSGNTGIGLALVAAVKGYKLVLVMGRAACRRRSSAPRRWRASYRRRGSPRSSTTRPTSPSIATTPPARSSRTSRKDSTA